MDDGSTLQFYSEEVARHAEEAQRLRDELDEESNRCARVLLALAERGVFINQLVKLLKSIEFSCPTTILVNSTIKTVSVCPCCKFIDATDRYNMPTIMHSKDCTLDAVLKPFREEGEGVLDNAPPTS